MGPWPWNIVLRYTMHGAAVLKITFAFTAKLNISPFISPLTSAQSMHDSAQCTQGIYVFCGTLVDDDMFDLVHTQPVHMLIVLLHL